MQDQEINTIIEKCEKLHKIEEEVNEFRNDIHSQQTIETFSKYLKHNVRVRFKEIHTGQEDCVTGKLTNVDRWGIEVKIDQYRRDYIYFTCILDFEIL